MGGGRDLIIDADGAILGRLASYAAKAALEGKRVTIIRAERAVITGNRRSILEKYLKRRRIQGKPSPEKGPVQPRVPDRILWKTIRGMLPIKKPRGREAMRRIRVYIGIPPGIELERAIRMPKDYTVEHLKPKKRRDYVTLGWLAERMGWRGGEGVGF